MRYQYKLQGSAEWHDVDCMAEVYAALENLPWHVVEMRVNPADRDLPVRLPYRWLGK